MKINVLGTEYEIRFETPITDKFLESCDGYCDPTSKTIVVNDLTKDSSVEVTNPEFCVKNDIRHELVHAFMFESGLGSDWEHKPMGHEETTVDWIARMFPKMLEAFKAAEAL